jgi:nucleoid-associated protein YejK
MDRNLEKLIQDFIDGRDVSVQRAKEISVHLEDKFDNDPYIDETIVMLAQYQPGGGDFLYGVVEMTNRLKRTVSHLRKTP